VAGPSIRNGKHLLRRRPSGFSVLIDHDAVVHVRGDLDCASAQTLSAAFESLTAGETDIVVACDALEFIDAAGLTVLVAAARSRGERGRVVLRDPSASARRLIDVAALDGLVVIVDTEGFRDRVS